MKKPFFCLVGSLFLGAACSSRPQAPLHHVLLIVSHFQKISAKSMLVIPEQVNILAIDLLRRQASVPECKNYIQWVLNHTSSGDRWGISGTIYDYRVFRSGEEESLQEYEAADSQAASFILLIREYFRRTGFRMMIEGNQEKIRDIAFLLAHLQDEDGLTRIRPDSDRKLLRNNCLVYAACGAFMELSREFQWNLESFYEEVREGVGDAIMEKLLVPDSGEFIQAVEKGGGARPDWSVADPDAFSQLFPILYLDRLEEERKQSLWKRFYDHHGDGFPRSDWRRVVVDWTRNYLEQAK